MLPVLSFELLKFIELWEDGVDQTVHGSQKGTIMHQ